jgi:two-component system, chemotaxis family, protein-glutamate methylesterase/glutaminase
LQGLVQDLPDDFPAAVLVAMHRAPRGVSRMADLVARVGTLPARDALDGDELVPGRILVAPADHHLMVDGDALRVVRGPRENRSRPAIDPLFRSAAVSRSSRVVGIILSGMLDDGTLGMAAVKRCGGLTLVQDPGDAEYADMPTSVLSHMEPDHVVAVDAMSSILLELVRQQAPPAPDIPRDLQLEVRAALDGSIGPDAEPGEFSFQGACPDCGGPLELRHEGGVRKYRCHVGHAFSDLALLAGQDEEVERALWSALRTLEERARTLESIAETDWRAGRQQAASASVERAAESRDQAERIRQLLTRENGVS